VPRPRDRREVGVVDGRIGPVVSAAATVGRIAALDVVKGLLVLLMVVYHWLNYFIGLQWGGYRYLRFLTPSFIFISGFVVSQGYLRRYPVGSPVFRLRLWRRGLKLLALFTALNVTVELTVGGRLHLIDAESAGLAATIAGVFVHGDARAAFDVLVSIGYFLLLAPVVVVSSKRLGISLTAMACGAVTIVLTLEMTGRTNPHIEMLSLALLGLAAGTRDLHWIGRTLCQPALLVGAYVG